MYIYVMRHGETDYNVKNIFQGRKEISLNNKGIEQAKNMAEKLRNIHIDIILVSPLIRARETARFVSLVTGINPLVETGLIERNFGDMEGKPNREDCNIKMLLDYDKNYNICNVEPIQSLFDRVYKCMDNIILKYKSKDILLVTHAGVAQAIDCYFNGLPKNKDLESITLKNAEIRKYCINEKSKIL